MLIALMTILFLGGGSAVLLEYIGDTEDAIKVVMEKDDRRKGALATVKEMKKRTKARNKQVKKTSKELSKVLANHDASSTDLDAVWDVYYAEVEAHNKEMLDLRFELHDRLTRDEWHQIFSEERQGN
jgi:RNAse (barnase) inhibitor barstar